MSTSFYWRLRAVILAGLVFAAFPTLSFANHAWNGYHWARTANPFTLQLGDNVSTAWDTYLAAASADWTASSVLDTPVSAGAATQTKRCQPTSGRVEVCSDNYGNNGWLGLARIWASGNHITQGIVKVNDSYFKTARYNTPGWRRLVMCQEIGHTLGLDHQDENSGNTNLGTCMDYTNNPSGPPSNEHPNKHDYDQLELIYSHLDSTNTVGQAVSKVPEWVEFNRSAEFGTAQWGKLIRSTNEGRTELYELDFSAGQKLFTFVIWAK